MGKKLKGKDLIKIGFPQNNTVNIALGLILRYRKRETKERILIEAKEVLLNPKKFKSDAVWGKVVEALQEPVKKRLHQLNNTRAPFTIFGENEIDEQAKFQLYNALKLPVAIKGALMPDAHSGYGLPIGGVLATDNAVIPYGVGVDIGCRMSMSIFSMKASFFKGREHQLINLLREHTKFGMYETHRVKKDHEIFSRDEFNDIPLIKSLKSKAYQQLGTSGSGNHFVEFGTVEIMGINNEWGVKPGEYFALLTHSGSRGLGATIAKHYTYLATKETPLPKNVQHLAWLNLNSHTGQEYWRAMNLAGDYAKACHDNIHERLTRFVGGQVIARIENHHNFAWLEMVDGVSRVVHRKGATPAKKGELGIIPGSMTSPGFIVKGKGNEFGLNSASHGAGRLFTRRHCKDQFTRSSIKKVLDENEVKLIGGGIDEAPMAYKDIHKVMKNQMELVDVIGKFTPKIVRMDK